MSLASIDLHRVVGELAALVYATNTDPHLFDGRALWRNLREGCRRVLAVIPRPIDLLDCDVLDRARLQELVDRIQFIGERYRLDLADDVDYGSFTYDSDSGGMIPYTIDEQSRQLLHASLGQMAHHWRESSEASDEAQIDENGAIQGSSTIVETLGTDDERHEATKLERALGLLVAHPEWKDDLILRSAGAHPKTRYKPNWARYREARQAMNAKPLFGTKSADGVIEAVDPNE